MTTLSPPPARENEVQSAEPASRWRRLIPRSRRGKTAVAGGLAVLLVAGVLGATYETSPGGALWGAEKAVFPDHAQDVALAAVVNDLKKAQDILGGGQQPTPDQLTDARTSLNQAKQDLDYLSPSPAADQPAEPLFATDTTTSAVHARFGAATACAAGTTSCAAGRRPGQPATDDRMRRPPGDTRSRMRPGAWRQTTSSTAARCSGCP